MHKVRHLALAIALLGGASGVVTPAVAEETPQARADEAVPAVQETRATAFGKQALNAETLNTQRGGDSHITTVVETTPDGTVTGNIAHRVRTGDNNISGGSFAGMVGIPMVVQNSGANVLIQNATTINVQLH
jgi:hypothetical protein